MYKVEHKMININGTDGRKNETVKQVIKYLGSSDNANIIGKSKCSQCPSGF